MSVCFEASQHPGGLLDRYLDRAYAVITAWGESAGNEEAMAQMGGWVGVDLAERIAQQLLLAAGYHEDLLDALADGQYPDGWSRGDMEAELERTRNKHGLVTGDWWERHFA